jgi:hypothetical protein
LDDLTAENVATAKISVPSTVAGFAIVPTQRQSSAMRSQGTTSC